MKIIDVKIGKLKTPLKRPFKTALRTAHCIEDFVIQLIADNELVGYGSCAQTPLITGETNGSLLDALLLMKEKVLKTEFHSIDKTLHAISSGFIYNSSALSCFDMALHDLYCKNFQIPLYKYLGGDHNIVFSNMTISCNEINVMIQDSLAAVEEGFFDLKIKVGLEPQHDFERIYEIAKAVGPSIKLRIDANQGWKAKEAIKIIKLLEKHELNIELIEQPVKAHNIEGLAFIRNNVTIPILADESVFSPQDALKIAQLNAADLINIKLAKAGGILAATKIYHIAEAAFIDCFMGCMLESPVAVSAAIHFAASKRRLTLCDLDPPFLVSENPVESSLQIDGNALTLDENTPGLGIKAIHDLKNII